MTLGQVINLNGFERISRMTFSIALILLVVLIPMVPIWLALVAIYPAMTASLAWDPLYTLMKSDQFVA